MALRSLTNLVSLFLFVPFCVKGIRWAMAWWQDVESIRSVVDLAAAEGVTINWPFIYDCMALAGLILLVALNFDIIKAWRIKRRESSVRNWNMTVPEAINWIANNSYQGKSMPVGNHYLFAKSALEEKLRDGSLRVAGLRSGIHNQIPIPKRELRGLTFHCTHSKITTHSSTKGVVKEAIFIKGEQVVEKTDLAWMSLMVDKKEVKSIWPGDAHGNW